VVSPEINGVIVTSSQSITVNFSERLDPTAAKNKNNYSISRNISIISVQLLPDSMGIKLKTSKQAADIDYTLTVSNIKDRSGNFQSPNPKISAYRIPKRIKGNYSKSTISNVSATTWEQNYTPQKTIDGLGMSSPDSRWQSAKLMPDTISYDFNENVSIDSLRISFYKAESGRLYKYSVYSSADLNEWSPIVQDIWSDDSEWTEIEFDSISCRYVKLVLKESNQASKASIWEFESFGTIFKENQDQNPANPETFNLSQNYPNPFNPSTKINYSLQTEGLVTLKVFNILGQEVATLINDFQTAGSHTVSFNASKLSSGIYLYKIDSNGFTQTKKMMLIK
jgi:hypothetical protein